MNLEQHVTNNIVKIPSNPKTFIYQGGFILLEKQLVPEIGLAATNRQELVQILNTVLADEHLLYTETRHAHWNIAGWQFYALHELLEEQYGTLALQADQVAERVRMLGGRAIGTINQFLQQSRLKEKQDTDMMAEELIQQLLTDHEQLIANLRADIETATEDYHDQGTADLLIGILRAHEKMAWMLRATISPNS